MPDVFGGDADAAALIPVLDAVVEGVLDQGLQDEPGNREMAALFGEFEGADELITVADFLNDAVLPGVVVFLFQGNEAVAGGKASPEQFGKGGNHGDDIILTAFGGHPDDRIQGVIEKMRVDLALKGFEIAFPELAMFFFVERQQVTYRFYHDVEILGEGADFIVIGYGNGNVEAPFLDLLDRFTQVSDRFENPGGDEAAEGEKQDDPQGYPGG